MSQDYVILTDEGDKAVVVTVTSLRTDEAGVLEDAVCDAIEGAVADDQVVER